MPPELPPHAAIEPIWVLEATYAPDAAESRVPWRGEHIARILALRDAGVIIEAGGYLDVSTALVLIRAASEEEALAIAREDVYTREGVWVELRVKPLGRVVRKNELAAS